MKMLNKVLSHNNLCIGENNGLELLLDTESYDYVLNLNEMGSVGFKISVDHPLDMPVIQESGERHL